MSSPITSVRKNPSLKIVEQTIFELKEKSWFNLNTDLKSKQLPVLEDIKVKMKDNILIKSIDDFESKLSIEQKNVEILFKGGVFNSIGQNMLTKLNKVATLTNKHVKAIYHQKLKFFNREIQNNELCINATDSLGRTALMYAAQYGHANIINFLLENGADINMTNDVGHYIEYEGILRNQQKFDSASPRYSNREGTYSALIYAISPQHMSDKNDYIIRSEILIKHMTLEEITKATEKFYEQPLLREPILAVINMKKKELMTSFLLGTHSRVGKNSSITSLPESGIYDLNNIREIFEFTGWMENKTPAPILD